MTVTRPWASVVIPIKDERDNLVPLTEQLVKVLDAREESRSAPFELIFIDDGSSDGSSEVLDSLVARYRTVKVFTSTGTTASRRPSMPDSSGRQGNW
jgi:dolichol-phosphate mannosyltransferase